MASESSQHEAHHEVGHVVPVRILFATGMGLLALTVLTVVAASFDVGNLNIWIALAIAVLKGSLVVMFFMHLRYDRPFHGVVFVTSLAFVALFISFALTDTTEYAGDLNPGDAPKVVEKLTVLGE
ncbi:MAG: cytochrome C oxidase subunit IV family protein [Phycisphaerales bacterium]